jgi:HEAT repeat protein
MGAGAAATRLHGWSSLGRPMIGLMSLIPCTLFYLLGLGEVQDPATLVERLRSERVEDREEAARDLLLLGEGARGALLAAGKDPDGEVVSRALEILHRLDLRRLLTPALLQAIPEVDRRLAGPQDKEWTAVLLEAAEQTSSRRRFPTLGSADLEGLGARAMRGADPGNQVRVCRIVGRWHLTSAAPEVAKLLGDPEKETRHEALEALKELQPRSVAPALLSALKKENDLWLLSGLIELLGSLEVRESAGNLMGLLKESTGEADLKGRILEALGSVGTDALIPELLALVKESPAFLDPNRVASTLARLGVDKSMALLLKEADGAGEEGRLHPLMLLCQLPSPRVLPVVRRLLKDKDPRIRSCAQGALVRQNAGEAIPDLKTSLSSPDRSTRINAAQTLSSLGDPSGLSVMVQELDDRQLRSSLLQWISMIDAREAFPRLMDLANQGEPEAAYILVLQGGGEWISRILPLCKDESNSVQLTVGTALAMAGSAEATPLLIPLLSDPDLGVRYQAQERLGSMGRPETYEPLLEAARRGAGSSHYPAIRYLGRVAGRKAVPFLDPLLEDAECGRRREALIALEEAGALELLPRARALLADEDASVRLQAATWLTRSGSREGIPTLLASGYSLFVLNSVRSPESWKRLVSARFKAPLLSSGFRGLQEIARATGMKVAPDEDFGGPWPYLSWGARDAGEALGGSDVILEGDSLRVRSREATLRFWRDWWLREQEKEPR